MEYLDYKKIIATKAAPSERMLLEIHKTDIKLHYSSLTDSLDSSNASIWAQSVWYCRIIMALWCLASIARARSSEAA